jgi:VacB/RNase II family 3'-5' exoribonuclease
MADNYQIDLEQISFNAMRRYDFEPEFPKLVWQEVKAINEKQVLRQEAQGLRDLTSLMWSSIDNADSLDLDQLEYCERGLRQEILVKVAIADVDMYVPKGSRADVHAVRAGNSVYTGVRTFPMLPEKLSTDLSSLRVGKVRVAIVVEFAVLKNGDIRQGDVYRALVLNKAKLIYDEVGAWLEGRGAAPVSFMDWPGLEAQVKLQAEAALRLHDFRIAHGALELESIETKSVIEKGMVVALVMPQDNQAHHIIENLMIAANRTVMDKLGNAGIPVIQRVVRSPKDWPGIRAVAAEQHCFLPVEPNGLALSKFLLQRKALDPKHFPELSLTIVKLMGPGEYEVLVSGKNPTGHFGLAVSDYTHATAPNRRYVDLIIQRLLKACLAERRCPYTAREMSDVALWCTDRDKAAKKVERFMHKVEAAMLLEGRIGEVFNGEVTGASVKGTYVRLSEPPVEGRVTRGFERMRVGGKVRVRLTGVNPREGHVDLVRVRE